MWGEAAVVVAAGYIIGSFPTAYLLARWLKGIDIRSYGTGNVGGTNVGVQVGAWATIAVGLVDIAKGAFPPLLALWLHLDSGVAVAAGVAAVSGHDWSVFLGFKGGRGMATTLGCLLVLAPWAAAVVLASLLIGRIIRLTAFVNGIGMALVPFMAPALRQSASIVLLCLGLAVVAALKRLLANGEPYPPGVPPARARLNRLLLDRDVGPRDTWGEQGQRTR